MTLIVNQKCDQIVNLAQISHIYVGEDNTIKAVVAEGQKMLRLGAYPDYDCATQALHDILNALFKGAEIAPLPAAETVEARVVRSRDPAPNKFAGNGKKAVRRGGS